MSRFLNQRVALISGGLGDIGRAIALALAQQGAHVALGDVRATADTATFLKQLQAHAVQADFTQVDVTDFAAVNQWIQAVERKMGVATIAVPNAGVVTTTEIKKLELDDWQRQLRVNLDGAFYLAKQATDLMRSRGRTGHVVFIGSWAAHAPHRSLAAYCVSKAGLRMLCQCLALELASDNILVNEVAPGYVNAGLSKQLWDQNPGQKETALQRVPVNRLIEPSEVARQVVALCHPENRNITGSVVLMDGGLSLRR